MLLARRHPHRLLTDQFPYDVSGTLARTFDQIQPRRADAAATSLPPTSVATLQAVMAEALAKDKLRRYQSVSDLRADLERYVAGRPVTARGDGALYTLAKFARRHRATSAGLVATVFFSITFGVRLDDSLSPAWRNTPSRPAPSSATPNRWPTCWSPRQTSASKPSAGAAEPRRAILEKAYAN